MPTKPRSIRQPDAWWTLVEAEAERTGESANALIGRVIFEKLSGQEPEPSPEPAPRPSPSSPRGATVVAPAPPRKAAVAAPAGVVKASELPRRELGRGGRAMEAAGVMEWDPNAKRPQYRPSGQPTGAGKRRGR